MYDKSGRRTAEQARQWMHQPVCVILKDGSRCVGWMTALDENTLTISGSLDRGKRNHTSSKRTGGPVVSAFGGGSPAFNAFEGGGWGDPFGFSFPGAARNAGGGGGGLGGLGGLGGFVGFFKQVWPGVQIGMNIVKAVMPLMGGFKF